MSHTPFARRSRAQTPSRIDCLRKRPLARAVAWAVLAALMVPSLPVFAAEAVLTAENSNATNAQAATAAAAGGPVLSDGEDLGADVGVFSTEWLGWRVEANDSKLLAAATGDADAKDGGEQLPLDANGRADAKTFAAQLQARALRAGFASVYTQADPDAGVIRLSYLPVHVTESSRSGNDYLRYFAPLDGHNVSARQLEAATRLTQDAAAINGDHVAISLSNPSASGAAAPASAAGTDAGSAMPLAIASQPAGQGQGSSKTWGAGLTVSDYGARYSSPDTITESVYGRIADGVQADASASQGLPGLPPHGDDSQGGHFFSESAGVRAVTPIGEASIRYSHTDYRQGGPDFGPFDVNGTIDRLDAQVSRPLSSTLTANVGLVGLSQRQSIGVADLNDRQNLVFMQAGVDYNGAIGSASARVMQGLAGSDNYNYAPLSGPFNANFTAFALDLNKSIPLATRSSLSLGARGQVGSSGTPSAVQFYSQNIGFDVGNLAGPDGAELSARVNYAATPRWTLYVGLDATAIKPVSLSTQTESSVVFGARTAIPYHYGPSAWTADVGFAQPTHAPEGTSRSPMLRFLLSTQF